MTEDDLPILPYAGSSGWSGTETSRERAERDDASGATSERQRRIVALLEFLGSDGATWAEIADALGLHHGQASGALSVLHHAGRIARLTERRNRSLVYVALEHVDGRPLSEPSQRSSAPEPGEEQPPQIPEGHLAVMLPADLVAKISRGKRAEPMSIPPAVADQIRAACSAALEQISEP